MLWSEDKQNESLLDQEKSQYWTVYWWKGKALKTKKEPEM